MPAFAGLTVTLRAFRLSAYPAASNRFPSSSKFTVWTLHMAKKDLPYIPLANAMGIMALDLANKVLQLHFGFLVGARADLRLVAGEMMKLIAGHGSSAP